MFLEHDDIYQGGGHHNILQGPKLIEAQGECRSNHEVICALAKRLGASHPGFELTALQLIDETLKASGWGDVETLRQKKWIDCQPDFETAHYLKGFAHADGKFRFKPDWERFKPQGFGLDMTNMPRLPDHWAVIEESDAERPFRLVTAPARNYLNSSFTETPTSKKREVRPHVKMHPEDARKLGVADGGTVRLGNRRGSVLIHVQLFPGVRRGVVIVESVWPSEAFIEGMGINALTGADQAGVIGGGAFHDNAVWIRPEAIGARAEAEAEELAEA
jgi:anaerobic selenocysteine-containing dehydrogenase